MSAMEVDTTPVVVTNETIIDESLYSRQLLVLISIWFCY